MTIGASAHYMTRIATAENSKGQTTNHVHKSAVETANRPNQDVEASADPEPQNQLETKPPLGRSKTVIKNTDHSKVKVDSSAQPQELSVHLNQNCEHVNFIRITKHQPSRKNMKQQLIFCHNEIREDYKFSKYLE